MKQKILTYAMLLAIAMPFIIMISLVIYELSQMIIDNKCTVSEDTQYFEKHDCQRFMRE